MVVELMAHCWKPLYLEYHELSELDVGGPQYLMDKWSLTDKCVAKENQKEIFKIAT